jgi:hypothetical protein
VDVTLPFKVGDLGGEPPCLHPSLDPIKSLILEVELFVKGAALGHQLTPSLVVLAIMLDFHIGGGVVEAACSLPQGVELLRGPVE